MQIKLHHFLINLESKDSFRHEKDQILTLRESNLFFQMFSNDNLKVKK